MTLCLSQKLGGGAGIPDASLYHKAAVLTRMVDWFHHTASKLWVQIEGYLNPIELCALSWTPAIYHKGSSHLDDLTRQTVPIWDRLTLNGIVSSTIRPHDSIFQDPCFPSNRV